jgi:hypothetical protein
VETARSQAEDRVTASDRDLLEGVARAAEEGTKVKGAGVEKGLPPPRQMSLAVVEAPRRTWDKFSKVLA